jgi:Spy/CpxP family protein refolding chaperone
MITIMRAPRSLVGVAALLMLPFGSALSAQDQAPGDVPQGRTGRSPAVVRPAELAAMLDAYELVQAQTALQLSDSQYPQFVMRLKKLQETRRRQLMQRARLLQELRKLTMSSAGDDAAIRERLKALSDLDEQSAATIRRESAAVDEILDPRQQAQFRLLEDRVERQKLDLLMRARDRAGRRGEGK